MIYELIFDKTIKKAHRYLIGKTKKDVIDIFRVIGWKVM